jgi:pSer/pThr/pTyr-binding forkhead associated (FHA) protein
MLVNAQQKGPMTEPTGRGLAIQGPGGSRWISYEDRDGPHRLRLALGEWVIGRGADCDIVIQDFGVSSRRHAKLVVDEQTVRLVDLKSKGGTHVNSVPITDTCLADGDHILIGHFPLRFFHGAGESAVDEIESTTAPEAWRHSAPDRRALMRRLALLKGRPPESLDEHTPLRELGGSLNEMMHVISTIQRECAVTLPWDELMRINTISELVTLVCNAPKVEDDAGRR